MVNNGFFNIAAGQKPMTKDKFDEMHKNKDFANLVKEVEGGRRKGAELLPPLGTSSYGGVGNPGLRLPTSGVAHSKTLNQNEFKAQSHIISNFNTAQKTYPTQRPTFAANKVRFSVVSGGRC